MPIDVETLLARRLELQEAVTYHERQTDLIRGAIADVDFWLGKLTPQPATPEAPPKPKRGKAPKTIEVPPTP